MTIVGSDTLLQSYPAVPTAVPLARQELVDFAVRAGAREDQAHDIRLSVSEALTNVVIHAYRGEQGRIHVRASVAGSELWVLIGDDGAGLRTRSDSPGLGVGLALIAHASDGMTILNRAGGGTEVRMRFALGDEASEETYERGSSLSASSPPSPRFSTTT